MKGPNLSALAVREQSVTLFLMIALIAAGVFAFFRLGRAEDPSFTVKIMTISAAWPGATAKEMQDQVADPLEKRLQELRYYDRVETQARPGLVTMTVTFKDMTPPAAVPEEFYQARKKLSDEASRLPRGVTGPFFNDEYSDVYFSLIAVQAKGMAHRDLVAESEQLRTRLLAVPGVKKVNIIGEQAERIYVDISYRKLATLGVTPDALIGALGAQNLVTPAGSVETGAQSVTLRASGQFDSLDAVRLTPIAVAGRSFRVGDVAEVRRGYDDPPSYVVRHGGDRALMLGVIMREQYNGTALGDDLGATLDDLRAELPLGLTLTEVADQALNINQSYGEFIIKFAIAIAVIMAVSLIALGWRVGVVVAAAVPLTLAVVFLIMLATGRSFDRITLGALILSLGLLVDDAIIAIEMMVVKMEEGLDRAAAATFAWGATAGPMLTGTVVTVIGFLPVGFAASTAGEYAGNIFWIVGYALLVSWIVAVYFVPYLGVKLLPEIPRVEGGHDAIYATARYSRLRKWITVCVERSRLIALVTFAFFLLAGVILVVAIPKQFFPSSDRPEIMFELYLPKGTSIDMTERVAARLERDIAARAEAVHVNSYVGAGAPRFFLSLNPELPDPSFAKIVVRTESAKDRDTLRAHIERRVCDGAYPEARVRAVSLLFGPPVPYPVVFRISGPDLNELRRIGAAVADVVRANSDARDVNTDWGERAPTLKLVFDQDRLRQIGLDPSSVAQQVNALVSGVTVSQARLGIRTVAVIVRAPLAEGRKLGAIGDLSIATASGIRVPLSQVAQLVPDHEEPLLVRRDRQPTLSVRADVAHGVQPPDVTAAIVPKLETLIARLPEGYAITPGGSVEESGKANQALAPLFPIMIILMLTAIMLQTRAFRMTGLVFATAPLGMIGAVPALAVTGMSFGFNAILGLIGLAGILMRNTLILVDQIDAERGRGLALREAVIEATVRRARPVLLTALAAVLAFLPLTLSSFWGPLAVVLIGGTLVGTVLTLFFLPALYALWFGVRQSPEQRQIGPDNLQEGATT